MNHKAHISELTEPGDYCFVKTPENMDNVVLKCPFCGQIMTCAHTVVHRDPITLGPSIVGPDSRLSCNCGHHFFIENGQVKKL